MARRIRDQKFISYFEDAVARLRGMGLSPTLIEALRAYGLLATDNVTGFHEGRSGGGRVSTLRRVIRHVRRSGVEAFYIEMDVQNLGGLNAALGHSGANQVFAEMAAVVLREFTAAASEAVFFRHGGDEMSAFLIDTTEAAVRSAMDAVRAQVVSLARRRQMDAIPHPKYPTDARRRGIGIHFGICRILAAHEADPTMVFAEADAELEGRRRVG
jgi:GGDEF domain-containing protein